MLIAFELSMPGNNAWNGKWTGEGQCYAKIISFGVNRVDKLRFAIGSYSYNFRDGWRTNVTVRIVDATEARRLRKTSRGFCGYDWMIESIRFDGAIYGPTQPKPELKSIQPFTSVEPASGKGEAL